MMLNIAEGNGEHHGKERARFFTYSRRSAEECAACMDGLIEINAVPRDRTADGKSYVKRIVEMLVKMIQKADPEGTASWPAPQSVDRMQSRGEET